MSKVKSQGNVDADITVLDWVVGNLCFEQLTALLLSFIGFDKYEMMKVMKLVSTAIGLSNQILFLLHMLLNQLDLQICHRLLLSHTYTHETYKWTQTKDIRIPNAQNGCSIKGSTVFWIKEPMKIE